MKLDDLFNRRLMVYLRSGHFICGTFSAKEEDYIILTDTPLYEFIRILENEIVAVSVLKVQ